eukprot:m.131216 g.131216  ORF g.131216 m.131216 type:complete len:235 (+) comp52365_c0_seq3:453-1157(+)
MHIEKDNVSRTWPLLSVGPISSSASVVSRELCQLKATSALHDLADSMIALTYWNTLQSREVVVQAFVPSEIRNVGDYFIEFDTYILPCNATATQVPRAPPSQSSGSAFPTSTVVPILVCFVLLVVILLVVIIVRSRRTPRKQAHNFLELLNSLSGLDGCEKLVPRELPRANLRMVSVLGDGNFGTVWKGQFGEHNRGPSYLVAIKVHSSTYSCELTAACWLVFESRGPLLRAFG